VSYIAPTEDLMNTLELIGNVTEWLEGTQAKLKAARSAARKLAPSYELHALLSQIESLKKDEKTQKAALAGLNEKLAAF
jgi:capsule polysaccharide export protein KpsE/RkpR